MVCTIPIHSLFDPSAVTAENNEKYKIEIFQPTKTHIIMKKVIGEFYKLNS